MAVTGRAAIVPDWLAEVVRPKLAPPPWADMLRAALAICVPLAAGMALGEPALGSLPAMGGLMSVMVDNGGPYPARMHRVATAAIFGGAPGLALGAVIHGRGWLAVMALVLVAGISAVLATLGATGSITGLQLLVYTALGLGPLGSHRPWWTEMVGFVAGAVWALLLLVPGWMVEPRGAEQRAVAEVYHALARDLLAIGTPRAQLARRNVTTALNRAYDMVVTARSLMGGRSKPLMSLTAELNASHLVAEATVALRVEGRRPPTLITDTLDRLAEAVGGDGPVPVIPPPWSTSTGSRALRDALVALAELLSHGGRPSATPIVRPSLRERLADTADQLRTGTFALRLMTCVGVAALLSEVLPLARSYWVVLTTAIVLKPDYGSVFARAVERGLGTILGAALGAAILVVVPYGPWLLVPFTLLAGLLPYGRARSFGLAATFLTPVVVLLTDILTHSGWRLAEDRLLDTVLGCLVVLVIGYALWPASWHAHLPERLASTIRAVCGYMEEALIPGVSGPAGPARTVSPPTRSRMRRRASRAISDLRVDFQRTMSEPPLVRRRASALWPAVAGLDDVVEVITATAVRIRRGAPAPNPDAVRQLAAALGSVADAIESDPDSLGPHGPLPDDPALKPVTSAVHSVLGVLTRGAPQP